MEREPSEAGDKDAGNSLRGGGALVER